MSTADKEQAEAITPGCTFVEEMSSVDRAQAAGVMTRYSAQAAPGTVQALECSIRDACDQALPMSVGYELVKKDNPNQPWGTIRITIEVRK